MVLASAKERELGLKQPSKKAPSGPHRRHQGLRPQYRQHPLEVVRQNMQAHLGTDLGQRPGEEMCGTHPGFQRAERMLDGLPSRSHGIGGLVQAGLHRIQYVFMLPARHLALRAWRALLLEAAVLAIGAPVVMQS